MPSDDIVARIRVWSTWLDERCPDTDIGNDLREAADEIERLRKLLGNAEQLRAERDDARRLYCEKMSVLSRQQKCTPRWFAEEMGWDCCEENTDD